LLLLLPLLAAVVQGVNRHIKSAEEAAQLPAAFKF
jgi:hypothetical protein